ncbi:hypothetical protein [Cupriavidus metallidurans]|uniref:hypothetical protein n=1 Tax=Cupriavidus metallidurans TaxID=119219 RepID=UPI001CCF236A|nr:hypothetical protein [Cupriavidus metallidurans]UBM12757.1 hypothetical protein LAI70_27785 [Cupriavidus metallidurans]
MTKYLNLDEVSTTSAIRKVRLFEKDYVVSEMTVDNFIETQRAVREVDVNDQLASTEALVQMVKRWIPDIDMADLRRLTMIKLRTLLDFINGNLDEQIRGAAPGATPAPAAEGEKSGNE